MPTTNTPDSSEIGEVPSLFLNGSGIDAIYKGKRVVKGVDMPKADDINELRAYIEMAAGHTHQYVDNSGGGGRTTCG